MKTIFRFLFIFALLISIGSCGTINQMIHPPTATPSATLTATITPTSLPTLTPTPPPAVAIVNGIYIWQEDFDMTVANLRRAYSDTQSMQPSEETLKQEALDTLIDETLFQAAAAKDGIIISDEELDTRIQSLIEKAGGSDAFRQWLSENHYSESSFRRALTREISAAKIREKLFSEKLTGIEQIHAYQIFTATHAEANTIKTKLDLGLNFIDLAKTNDPITGGDLDWVARGILVYPQLEDALFALQPGSYSDIIETDIGFHILYAAERSTDHALTPQSRQILEHKILSDWVKEQKSSAEIIMLNK